MEKRCHHIPCYISIKFCFRSCDCFQVKNDIVSMKIFCMYSRLSILVEPFSQKCVFLFKISKMCCIPVSKLGQTLEGMLYVYNAFFDWLSIIQMLICHIPIPLMLFWQWRYATYSLPDITRSMLVLPLSVYVKKKYFT